MKGKRFQTAAILISVLLTATALLVLQLTGGVRLRALAAMQLAGDPSVRVIAEHPPVELVERRDDHTRVWEIAREVETSHPDGRTTVETVKSHIHEKGSGLCYRDASGDYVPSVPEWREVRDGFVIHRCAYGLSMGKTIASGLVYNVDGHELVLRPAYLMVSDGANEGHLAVLNPEAPGFIVPDSPSVVRFRAAFGPGYDLEYVAEKSGFHQKLVMSEPLALPNALDPRATWLYLYTCIDASDYIEDPTCWAKFGREPIDLGAGGLLTPASEADPIILGGVTERSDGPPRDGRILSFEVSPVYDCAGRRIPQTLAERQLVRDEASGELFLVESIPFAVVSSGLLPLLWDYHAVSGSIGGTQTWYTGETYFVSGDVYVSGTLIIEAGAFVKLNYNTSINVQGGGGQLQAQGNHSSYVRFTNAEDNDRDWGEDVTGHEDYEAGRFNTAISLAPTSSPDSVIQYCRMRYGIIGVYCGQTLDETNPIAHNIIRHMGLIGVNLQWGGGLNVACRNNLVTDCAWYGLWYYNAAAPEIRNNTVDHCGCGIELQDTNCDSVMDNVLTNCGVGIGAADGQLTVEYNGYWNCTYYNVSGRDMGVHSLELKYNPYAGADQFFLEQSSEFVDAGSQTASEAGFGTGWSTAASGASEAGDVDLGFHRYSPDGDEDGMPDAWETHYGLDPESNDASGDLDGDDRSNIYEYNNRLNPDNEDTDGDGTDDGEDTSPGMPSFAKGPYLQNVSYDVTEEGIDFYITVMVQSPTNVAAVARCRPSDSQQGPWYESEFHETQSIWDGQNWHYAHEARLQIPDAEADDEYIYKVGLNGGQLAGYDELYFITAQQANDAPWSFGTFPAQDDAFRFVVYGDSRTNYQTHESVINGMLWYSNPQDNPIRFVLHTGDFVTVGGTYSQWGTQFFGPSHKLHKRIPMFHSIGNHEYDGDSDASNYLDFFDLPEGQHGEEPTERWYSFDYANCHFVILDVDNSQWYDESTDPQRVWLDGDLEAAQSDSDIDWVFIIFHRPPYCYGGPHHPGEQAVRDNLVPVFEENSKVVAVFSGHSHYYQRLLKEDIDCVITGGGGAPVHTPTGSEEDDYWQAQEESNHWCEVDVEPSAGTVTLRARRISKGGIIETYQLYPTP